MQESGENYLETILILKNKNGLVRSIDVARELCVSKPSVSRAIGILKENGFISVEPGGELSLTDAGMARADAIYERHCLITKFLNEIVGVCPKTAEADACRIEHIISEETFEKIKEYAARESKPSARPKKGTRV
ncbi:MAG: metal-dependent transcriptional regulator [Cloacibacillus sp.]